MSASACLLSDSVSLVFHHANRLAQVLLAIDGPNIVPGSEDANTLNKIDMVRTLIMSTLPSRNTLQPKYSTNSAKLHKPTDRTHIETFYSYVQVSTVIFTVEFLIKIVSDGFIINRNAYLHTGWNVLDFIIVSLSDLPAFVCLCLPLSASVYSCLPLSASVCLFMPLSASVCLCLPLSASFCLCLIFNMKCNAYLHTG